MTGRGSLVTALVLVFGLAMVIAQARADEDHHHSAKGLPQCPIMDEPIDLGVSIPTDDGPVFFCCDGCIPKYKKNPAKYADKVAAQRKVLAKRAKVQVTCPVMGEPVNPKVSIQHNGQTVQLCCKGCVKKFKADPAKYRAALANSYTYQTKCPVMGEGINPKAFTKTAAGQTVYFCCKGCDKKFFGEPAKYAPKMTAQGFFMNPAKIKPAVHGHEGHGHGHGHDHGDG